jgi:hypothetical protein
MVSNTNDYQKKYMKEYVKNSKKVLCDICLGNYKLVYKYRHLQTKEHKKYQDFKNSFKII